MTATTTCRAGSLLLAAGLLAATAAGADSGAPRFRAPYMLSLPPTGGAVLRDFDGDGIPDMVVGHYEPAGNQIQFHRGRGDGTFELAAATPTNASPWIMAAGDMNGDGVDDLAMITTTTFQGPPQEAIVFEGQVGGTFLERARFPVGPVSYLMSVGDIEGDGFAEALFATSDSVRMVRTVDGTVFDLLTLAPPPFVQVSRVRLAPLSSAGPSLLVWGTNASNLAIYENDGAGGFLAPVTVATAIGIRDVIAADVAGDDALELLVTGSNEYEVIGPNGSGQWVTLSFGAPMFAATDASVASGDMDGDGHGDIVVANLSRNDDDVALLRFLPGRGDGTFGPSVLLASGAHPRALFHRVEIADLDADGDLDLWTYDGRPFVHLNTGPGAFVSAGPVYERPLYGTMRTMDFDLNGLPDIVVGYDAVFVGLSKPGGGFAWDTLSVAGNLLGYGATFADPDALPDLMAWSTTGITTFTGDGNGGFSPTFHSVALTGKAAAGDVDGDGWADLLQIAPVYTGDPWNPWSQQVRLFRADGSGGFAPYEILYTSTTASDLQIGDFNEDGLADILLLGTGSNTILVGAPEGAFVTSGTGAPFGSASNASVADFDGDGHLDVACDAQSRLTVCLGNGNLTFGCTAFESSAYSPIVSSADIDDDGFPDLLYSVEDRTVRVRHSLGDGTFGPMLGYGSSDAYGGATALDYDGDGVLDLVTMRGDGVHVNSGIPPEPTLSVPAAPLPEAARLHISPLPTRGTANLRFTLREAGLVSVDLHDLAGRKVRATSRLWMPSGENSFALELEASDARALAPGIYLVRVADPREARLGKLIVIR